MRVTPDTSFSQIRPFLGRFVGTPSLSRRHSQVTRRCCQTNPSRSQFAAKRRNIRRRSFGFKSGQWRKRIAVPLTFPNPWTQGRIGLGSYLPMKTLDPLSKSGAPVPVNAMSALGGGFNRSPQHILRTSPLAFSIARSCVAARSVGVQSPVLHLSRRLAESCKSRRFNLLKQA